ncbi:MAG: PaaI family thioesterase [Pseudomonadota bacterium]
MTAPDQTDKFRELFSLAGDYKAEGVLMTGLPHSAELGMRVHYSGEGQAILSVPWSEAVLGDPEAGILHGGVITALLDTACGAAVMASKARLKSTATLDLRIDYMRPARTGETVFCRAHCYRLTRSVGFARATAFHNDPDDAVASATAAFIVDRMEPKK